jgi:uncharacterized protein YijF (DUF1287 family)
MWRAAEQGDEADEAFGGMVARMDMPPHARAAAVGRGHRFAAYPRCSMDNGGSAAVKALAFAVGLVAWAASAHAQSTSFADRLVAAAVAQTGTRVTYDGSYRRIAYPGGDVPASMGVCTDVVIRAYRAVGVDLQVKVHEDMLAAFQSYPQLWRMAGPDANIDHRRVPNLQTFFRRHGRSLPITRDPREYAAGDLVTWVLPGNLPHIGVITSQKAPSGRPLVVHNIGRGPELEDMLFSYPITGHYSYPASR